MIMGMMAAQMRVAGGGGGGDPVVGAYWTGQGGWYAGQITYGDARVFHLVVADATKDIANSRWKTTDTETPGTNSLYDGKTNTDAMIASGAASHPIAEYVQAVTADGLNDFYIPSEAELDFIRGSLVLLSPWRYAGAQTFAGYVWTSTQVSASSARAIIPQSNDRASAWKPSSTIRMRPVRRVAVS